ncbi:MAG: hypothetical protein F6K55_11220 [Moorea sp. SIO4A3]|nr:hypothetical protein [Moorena sp. SIO4A3]
MGRWGDGEMGRWGDEEMGRWGDGEMRRWGLRSATGCPKRHCILLSVELVNTITPIPRILWV